MQREYPAGCTQYGLLRWRLHIYAGVAHLVERHLAKVEVAGSSPVARSILLHRHFVTVYFFVAAGLRRDANNERGCA